VGFQGKNLGKGGEEASPGGKGDWGKSDSPISAGGGRRGGGGRVVCWASGNPVREGVSRGGKKVVFVLAKKR